MRSDRFGPAPAAAICVRRARSSTALGQVLSQAPPRAAASNLSVLMLLLNLRGNISTVHGFPLGVLNLGS